MYGIFSFGIGGLEEGWYMLFGHNTSHTPVIFKLFHTTFYTVGENYENDEMNLMRKVKQRSYLSPICIELIWICN